MRLSHSIAPLLVLSSLAAASAEVPTYRVIHVADYSTNTVVRGASDAGHFVGYQVQLGQSQPFVATASTGLVTLPLPPGYHAGFANDANDAGVVVGAVSGGGFPFDGGEPAIWTPDGSGGYDVTVPQQFTTLPSPLNPDHPITGGVAVAVNNLGTVVGWSRYQGFQGGPTTQFSVSGPPVNLKAQGFEATVTSINDVDVIAGGGLRMDLGTSSVTTLGVPNQTGGLNFTFVLAYAINDSNETVLAASIASSTSSNWLTFYHSDADGFTQLNPGIVPSFSTGFYDNNDLGDISASDGVLFRAESTLVAGFDALLEQGSAHWDTSLGFIDNERRVYTTAMNTLTNQGAIVWLVPESLGTSYCTAAPNSTGGTGGLLALGSADVAANDFTLVASGLPTGAPGYFLASRNQGFLAGPGGSEGNLCLGSDIARLIYLLGVSDSQGVITGQPSLVSMPTNPPQPVLPGQTWNFQLWHRDVGTPPTSNFTTGLSVLFR